MINYQQPTNEHGNGRNPITSRKKNDGEIIIKLNKKKMQVTLSLAPQKHFNVSRSKSNIQNSNEGVGGYERGGVWMKRGSTLIKPWFPGNHSPGLRKHKRHCLDLMATLWWLWILRMTSNWLDFQWFYSARLLVSWTGGVMATSTWSTPCWFGADMFRLTDSIDCQWAVTDAIIIVQPMTALDQPVTEPCWATGWILTK